MGSGRLTRSTAEEVARRAAGRLAADPRVRLVYLYGSTTDEARSEVGDVDLAISCVPRLSLDELMQLRADVVADTGAPVDLVDLADAGVVLAWEVAESGRCLFARDPDEEVTFATRARARYWDFKPYLDEQWRFVGERQAERRRGSTS